MTPIFVRVAHRTGWQIETFEGTAVVESQTRRSREEALDYARSLKPDWIEVGDIIAAGTPGQHHRWTTLRRQRDGSYATSALRWQGDTPG